MTPLEFIGSAAAVVFGIGLAGGIVGTSIVASALRDTREKLQRMLQREVAQAAANETASRATIARLRAQRDALLRAAADARSALIEVQAEARAREEQIRRAAIDSGFGRL